jgi:cobalt-zinc-cadmium efflux system protein
VVRADKEQMTEALGRRLGPVLLQVLHRKVSALGAPSAHQWAPASTIVYRGPILLVVAGVGIAVNLIAVATLAKANRQSINIEGSYQHILTGLFAFIATFLAGGIIIVTDFNRADPIASLVVVALILKASYGLLKGTGRVLLELAPGNVHDLAKHDDVREVHDIHLWEIISGFPALSVHVLVRPNADCHGIRRNLEKLVAERYEITHTTLQVDHVSDSTVSVQSLVSSGQEVQRRNKDISTNEDTTPTSS